MGLVSKIKNKLFIITMHSGNEKKKEEALRTRVAYLGEKSRIYSDSFGSEPYLLWIGSNVIVASGVKFIEHDASYYNAHRYAGESAPTQAEKMGAIILEDNCFVGAGSTILGGTKIGRNSVIAAGSIVHGIIPPGEVWGGVPAHRIMSMDEYADKVIRQKNWLPWMENNKYLELSEEQLILERKKYYFSILDKNIV